MRNGSTPSLLVHPKLPNEPRRKSIRLCVSSPLVQPPEKQALCCRVLVHLTRHSRFRRLPRGNPARFNPAFPGTTLASRWKYSPTGLSRLLNRRKSGATASRAFDFCDLWFSPFHEISPLIKRLPRFIFLLTGSPQG